MVGGPDTERRKSQTNGSFPYYYDLLFTLQEIWLVKPDLIHLGWFNSPSVSTMTGTLLVLNKYFLKEIANKIFY